MCMQLHVHAAPCTCSCSYTYTHVRASFIHNQQALTFQENCQKQQPILQSFHCVHAAELIFLYSANSIIMLFPQQLHPSLFPRASSPSPFWRNNEKKIYYCIDISKHNKLLHISGWLSLSHRQIGTEDCRNLATEKSDLQNHS